MLPLMGGLGNQLFQLISAYAFAEDINAQLRVDKFFHFKIDFRYHQEYQIEFLESLFSDSSLVQSIMAQSLFRLFIRSSALNQKRIKFGRSLLIVEPRNNYEPIIFDHSCKDLFLIGYWQSPKYFDIHFEKIKPSFEHHANNLGFNLNRPLNEQIGNRVAVGFRFYEETRDPQFHAYKGRSKTLEDYRGILKRMQEELDNPQFYLFTTSPRIDEARILARDFNMEFVEETDPARALMLFASLDHHIFNNSTFYWWGAYLASKFRPESNHVVYASDNFLNQDIYLDVWKRF